MKATLRFLIPITAVASFGAASPLHASDSINLRLSWSLYGIHAPFFLAETSGRYAEEGLTVNIEETQGSVMASQMVAHGHDPVGFLDLSTMTRAVAQGMGLTAVYAVNQSSPMAIISHADTPIRTPNDLEGKILAMNPGESSAQVYELLLSLNAVDASKISVLNPAVGAKNALFLQRRVDGITGYFDVQPLQLAAQGASVHYMKMSDFGIHMLGNGIVANSAWLRENETQMRGFLRAVTAAWQEALESPEKAVDAMIAIRPEAKPNRGEYIDQLRLAAETLYTENTEARALGWMSEHDWASMIDIMVQTGALNETIEASALFTNEYIEALDP